MSAAGQAARIDADFYPTPEATFRPLLPYLPVDLMYWEPACGDRRIIRWLNERGSLASGSDLALGYDFLQDQKNYDAIVTNPPFSQAFEFCQHAVERADHVWLLLRLNFLGSQHRREWWQQHEPSCLFVLSERPKFAMHCRCAVRRCAHDWYLPVESLLPDICPKCAGSRLRITKSDNCEYAWFYWGAAHRGIVHL
jgi:hypothetical protein